MPHFCVWHLPSLFSFSRSLYPCSTNDTGKSRCPHIQSVAEPARAASGQWQEKFSDRQFHCFVVFLFVSLYCAQYYIILSKKVVISSRARAYIKFFTLATVATLQHYLRISMLRVTTRWQGWQRMAFLPRCCMRVAKPRAPWVEGAASVGRRCRLRGSKVPPPWVEGTGFMTLGDYL